MMKRPDITRDSAENLAILALSFLAADSGRLERFLAVTGMGPSMIRKAAADPAFLAGVLDHVAGEEGLLLAVAEFAGVPPDSIGRAQAMLSGYAV